MKIQYNSNEFCFDNLDKTNLICANCLDVLRQLPSNSVDIIFTDPPYAMGSEAYIGIDNKPTYKVATDFMNKWEQPNGDFWELYFKEAFRVLKYGGRVLMFGIDRTAWFNAYFACNAGFKKQMSIYWYFLSNFPKATDLSKQIDKNAGAERDSFENPLKLKQTSQKDSNGFGNKKGVNDIQPIPKTELAQKYNGYKYGIAPLKQVVEEIAIYQKPYKTNSCLHDTLAYENGDNECLCGAIDIDKNRIETNDKINQKHCANVGKTCYGVFKGVNKNENNEYLGRFPAQTFIDSNIKDILDKQSGLLKTGEKKETHNQIKNRDNNGNYISENGIYNKFGENKVNSPANIGGCSKILHSCDYDTINFDIYIYCPKISDKERHLGMENNNKNNHPTVKPLDLLYKILSLFKTPNPQICVGSGSIGKAALKLDMQFIGIEMNSDYVDIAAQRISVLDTTEKIVGMDKQEKVIKKNSQLSMF